MSSLIQVYESSDYRNYFNLVSHHDERKTNDMFHRFDLKPQQSWPNKKIFLTERCSPSSSSAVFRAKATSQILLKRLSPRTNIWSETFSATSLRCCSVQLKNNCSSEKWSELNWDWKLPGAPVQRARGSPVRDGDEDESRRRKVGFHWRRRLSNSCLVQPQVHLCSTTGTSRWSTCGSCSFF